MRIEGFVTDLAKIYLEFEVCILKTTSPADEEVEFIKYGDNSLNSKVLWVNR